MKIEERKTIGLSRKELEQAVLAFCGLPAGSVIDNFHVKSEALAEPQPVVFLTVITEQREV